MKITILVGGRFHAFNLAEEIDKKVITVDNLLSKILYKKKF